MGREELSGGDVGDGYVGNDERGLVGVIEGLYGGEGMLEIKEVIVFG